MALSETTTVQPTPRISVLIDATDQSGIYLARCLMALMTRSNLKRLNCEYIVIVDEADDHNLETVNFFTKYMETVQFLIGFAPVMEFVRKDPGSSELPLNILAKAARGHWILPIKASTIVKTENWDEALIDLVESKELSAAQIQFISVPIEGANIGPSSLYIVSQGYYLSLDHIAQHIHAEDYIFFLADHVGDPNNTHGLDIVVSDELWGSWERSFPENINELIDADTQTLTRMIKAGH